QTCRSVTVPVARAWGPRSACCPPCTAGRLSRTSCPTRPYRPLPTRTERAGTVPSHGELPEPPTRTGRAATPRARSAEPPHYGHTPPTRPAVARRGHAHAHPTRPATPSPRGRSFRLGNRVALP